MTLKTVYEQLSDAVSTGHVNVVDVVRLSADGVELYRGHPTLHGLKLESPVLQPFDGNQVTLTGRITAYDEAALLDIRYWLDGNNVRARLDLSLADFEDLSLPGAEWFVVERIGMSAAVRPPAMLLSSRTDTLDRGIIIRIRLQQQRLSLRVEDYGDQELSLTGEFENVTYDSLTTLFSMIGGPNVFQLPPALEQLGSLSLDRLSARINPDAMALTAVGFGIGMHKPWRLGCSNLSLDSVGLELDLTDPGGPTQAVSGAIKAVFTIDDTRLVLSAQRRPDGGWRFDGRMIADRSLALNTLVRECLGNDVQPPAEVPDVRFTSLRLIVTTSNTLTSIELNGELSVDWRLPFGSTSLTVDKASFRFKADSEKSLECTLSVDARGILNQDIEFESLAFAFGYESLKKRFALAGQVAVRIFGKQLPEVTATYEGEGDDRHFELTAAFDPAWSLFGENPLAKVILDKFSISVDKTNAATGYVVRTYGQLHVENIITIENAVLTLLYTPDKKGFRLTADRSDIPFRFVDDPAVPYLSLNITTIELLKSGEDWYFDTAVDFHLHQAPPQLVRLLPTRTAGRCSIGKDMAEFSLIFERRIDIPLPPLQIAEGQSLEIGAVMAGIRNIRVDLKNGGSLTAEIELGLPVGLNRLFGSTDDGQPKLKVFRTYDPSQPEKTAIGVALTLDRKGLRCKVLDSPIQNVDLDDKGRWKIDLRDIGLVYVDVPTLSLNTTAGTLQASGGFEIDRERGLRLPLTPVKYLLRIVGLDDAADQLADGIPIRGVRFYDSEKNEFRIQALAELFVQQPNCTPIPDELQEIFGAVNHLLGKFPKRLKDYGNISIPQHLTFNLDFTSDGGLTFNINTHGRDTIKLLLPGFPYLTGIELRSIAFGQMFGGALFRLDVDATIDIFDLVTLAGTLVLPDEVFRDQLRDSQTLQRTFTAEKLMVVIVYQTGVPVPVPLFFDKLDLSYVGLEGVMAQSQFRYPMPRLNAKEAMALLGQLIRFFSTRDSELELDKLPQKMTVRLTIGPNYIQLPRYLGDSVIGLKNPKIELDMLRVIAAVLNAIKKNSIAYLIQLIDKHYRVGSGSTCVLDFIDVDAAWLLTTPKEFRDGDYPLVDIAPKHLAAAARLLARDADVEGVVAMLHGACTVENLAGLRTTFVFVASGGRGFMTSYAIAGRIRDVIDVNVEGTVALSLSPAQFGLHGSSSLRFLNIPIFDGEVTAKIENDALRLAGDFRLLPPEFVINVRGKVNGSFCARGITLGGDVVASLGPVVLASVKAVVSAHEAEPRRGAWVEATWLGSSVNFAVEDLSAKWRIELVAELRGLGTMRSTIELDKTTQVTNAHMTSSIHRLYQVQLGLRTLHRCERVSFCSASATFLTVECQTAVKANRVQAGPWEQFTVLDPADHNNRNPVHYGDTVCLLCRRFEEEVGQRLYLAAMDTSGDIGRVHIDHPQSNHSHHWMMIDPSNPTSRAPIRQYGVVTLRSRHGTHLTDPGNHDDAVTHGAPHADSQTWTVIREGVQESSFKIDHLGLLMVEGNSVSTVDQVAFGGTFHLLPAGAPLSVQGAAAGWVRPGSFRLSGAISVNLLPGVLVGVEMDMKDDGLWLAVGFLGRPATFKVVLDRDKRLKLSFSISLLSVISLGTTVTLNRNGIGGTAAIRGRLGDLGLHADFAALPAGGGGFGITIANHHLIGGDINLSGDRFTLSGSINFGILIVRLSGSISSRGLYLHGRSDFSVGPIRMGAAVTIHNGPPTVELSVPLVSITAGFYPYRDHIGLLGAWWAGLHPWNHNHVAVGPHGLLSWGLGWESFPHDWPAIFIPKAVMMPQFSESPEGADALPLLDIVRVFLLQDRPTDPAIDSNFLEQAAIAVAGYQFEVQVLRQDAAAEDAYVTRVIINKTTREEDFFTDLQSNVTAAVMAEIVSIDPDRNVNITKLMGVSTARAVFENTNSENGEVTLTVECMHNGAPAQFATTFDFDNPGSAHRALAHLLYDPNVR